MKKLLVITGAGASKDFGLPMVNEVESLFKSWALERYSLVDDPNESLYTWVYKKLEEHCSKNSNTRKNLILNFESVLYTIQSLASLSNDAMHESLQNRLTPFIDLGELPQITKYGNIGVADGNDLRQLNNELIDKLLKHFRQICSNIHDNKGDELLQLRSFYEDLKTKFDVGFINLNYDNVILSAIPELKTGFNDETGYFDRGLFNKHNWNFCYHLHGSVHFDMVGGLENTEMHKIKWNSELNSIFRNSSGRNGNNTSEGLSHPTSSIIAGLDKANQLLREPFSSYYMKLDQLLYESDAILFIGYGFNDMHINKIIPFVRYDREKQRKVVVIDYAHNNQDGLNFRHDDWSFSLRGTLPHNGYEMGDGKSSLPRSANHFKKRNILEVSSNPQYPLGVWYNGLTEAFQHSDVILEGLI